jgi:hypothetical protein
MRWFIFLLLGFFASCGFVNYDDTIPGEFDGSLLVMWVGEGGPSGDGRFVYVPSPTRPLTFKRHAPDATVTTITPGFMYTDGGSIPRQAQVFEGFSPWGYAPAYMVHDWIFVARHCLTDGDAAPEHEQLAAMDFGESANVMAEAIKALIASGRVKENDVAPRVISGVVAGPFSHQRWTVKGACAGDRLSRKHELEVQEALGRRFGISSLKRRGQTPATVVAEFEF